MADSRRHHIVPKFLLRRFADNDRIVAVRRSDTACKIVMSVDNACVRRDFYAIASPDGSRSTEAEDALSTLEGEAATALRQLVETDSPPSADVKNAIAWFLAVQTNRGNDQRNSYSLFMEHCMKMTLAVAPREWYREKYRAVFGHEPTDSDIDELRSDARQTSKYRIATHPNEHIRLIFELAESLVPYFQKRSWKLVRFPSPTLITADCPFALITRQPTNSLGLATADAILFPIGSDRLLTMEHPGQYEGVFDGSEQFGRSCNLAILQQSHEWAYHSPRHAPLDGVSVAPREPNVVSGIGVGEKFRDA